MYSYVNPLIKHTCKLKNLLLILLRNLLIFQLKA